MWTDMDRGEGQLMLVVDQLNEMGAIRDARRETGERDHRAVARKLLETLRPSVLRFAMAMEDCLRECWQPAELGLR